MQNTSSKIAILALATIMGLSSTASYAQVLGGGMTPPPGGSTTPPPATGGGGTGGGNSCDVTDASGLLHTYTMVNGVIYDCPWYSDGNGGFTSGSPFNGGCTTVSSAPCSLDDASFKVGPTIEGTTLAIPD